MRISEICTTASNLRVRAVIYSNYDLQLMDRTVNMKCQWSMDNTRRGMGHLIEIQKSDPRKELIYQYINIHMVRFPGCAGCSEFSLENEVFCCFFMQEK